MFALYTESRLLRLRRHRCRAPMTVMTTTEDIRDWPTSSHAAVLDASRIDSGWSCARLASGSRISRAADPDAPFLWPRTADLHGPNETLPKLPAAAYSLIRLHAKHMSRLSRGSNVATSDLRYLHHLVNVSEAVTTGETGFASGLSALAMLTALRGGDAAAVHYSIDPFQPAFNNDGLRAVQLYERRVREQARTPARFVHLNATAGFGLAWLLRQRTCFDLFFMDDGHKFDENMVELYFVAKLLAVGGVLVLHDDWMESVQANDNPNPNPSPNTNTSPDPSPNPNPSARRLDGERAGNGRLHRHQPAVPRARPAPAQGLHRLCEALPGQSRVGSLCDVQVGHHSAISAHSPSAQCTAEIATLRACAAGGPTTRRPRGSGCARGSARRSTPTRRARRRGTPRYSGGASCT